MHAPLNLSICLSYARAGIMIGQLSRQTVEVLSACRRTTPCNNVCRPLKGVGPQYCPDYAAGPMYVCATWSVVVRPEQSSSWLAVFVAYGVYALAQTRSNPQLRGALMAVLSVLGGIGLVFNRQWSKYCIYVVSAAVGGTWFFTWRSLRSLGHTALSSSQSFRCYQVFSSSLLQPAAAIW